MNDFLKNIKNIGKKTGNSGDLAQKLADAAKQKIMIWLASVAMTILPYVLIILIVVILIAAVLAPFMGFFGGLSGNIGDDGVEERSPELTAFLADFDERTAYWKENNVIIDANLVRAFLYYSNPNITDDIECDDVTVDECLVTEEENYTELTTEATKLMDNMVDSKTIYYCQPKKTITKEVCTPDLDKCYMTGHGQVCDEQICKTEVVVSLEDKKVCGEDSASCKVACGSDYNESKETVYYPKTKETYIKWIKENYIEDKLIALEVEIPADETLKEKLINDTVDEIYSLGESFSDADSGFFSGIIINSYGEAGPMPAELITTLQSPLGAQACRQSSCFGDYGLNICSEHGGVDVIGAPNIYSVAAGKIVTIAINSENCKPNFKADPKCPGCSGPTMVTVQHEIIINGKTQTIYSKYLHLASLAEGIVYGAAVYPGQLIGIMGNTGCSSGEHLHFELLDAAKKSYNSEELFYAKGCRPVNGDPLFCAQARTRCGV